MECLSSEILPFGNILPYASLFTYNVTEREHELLRKLPMGATRVNGLGSGRANLLIFID